MSGAYEAWIMPHEGEPVRANGAGFNVAIDTLDDAAGLARHHAPCEVFVIHKGTKEIRFDLSRLVEADGSFYAPVGSTNGRSTYDVNGQIWAGADPKELPCFEQAPEITKEELLQQADQLLDEIELPNANGHVIPPSVLRKAFKEWEK